MGRPLSDSSKGHIALICLALSYSLFGPFSRILAQNFPIFQQVFVRFLAATLLGLIIYRSQINTKTLAMIPVRDWILLVIRGLAGVVLGVTLYSYSVLHASLGGATLIVSIPFSALWGVILFKENLGLRRLVLLILSLIGVILISAKNVNGQIQFGRGEIAAVFSAIFFTLGLVLRKWHSESLSNEVITIYYLAVCTCLLLIASLIAGEQYPTNLNTTVLGVIFISGAFIVFNIFVGHYGFQKVDAVVAGNVLMLESVFAIMVGYFFYDEILSKTEAIGGLLVLVSVAFMAYKDPSQNSPD